jgi:hypothetical protein
MIPHETRPVLAPLSSRVQFNDVIALYDFAVTAIASFRTMISPPRFSPDLHETPPYIVQVVLFRRRLFSSEEQNGK